MVLSGIQMMIIISCKVSLEWKNTQTGNKNIFVQTKPMYFSVPLNSVLMLNLLLDVVGGGHGISE